MGGRVGDGDGEGVGIGVGDEEGVGIGVTITTTVGTGDGAGGTIVGSCSGVSCRSVKQLVKKGKSFGHG